MKKYIISTLCILLLVVTAFKFFSTRDESADESTANVALDDEARNVDSQASDPALARKRISQATTPVQLDEKFDRTKYRDIPYEGGKQSGDDGSRAYVKIPSSSSRLKLAPNQLGQFPTQEADPEEVVAIRLDLPEVKPGTPVSVVIMDGGKFPDQSGLSRLVECESWGGIDITYKVSPNYGHHRVRVLPSGGEAKILDFFATHFSPIN